MALREILTEELKRYILYTVSYINTVKDFLSRSSEWIRLREAESEKLRGAEAESGYKDEAELEKGLEETLWGLEEMQIFLDAVERLAVTSRLVFEQNQVLQLPDGADLETVQNIVFVAQLVCPLLISFKRDNEAFFKPKLENSEVMQKQLNLYITNIKLICHGFRNSPLDELSLDNFMVALNEDVSDDDVERMFSKIRRLNEYRMDEDVRLLVLFQDNYEVFMKEFSERKEKMLQYLSDVEACAVQLDDMNKGARISSVVGSSVGFVSGILSIVGLALIPVTAGVSLGLVAAGAGLGVVSGANGLVTSATEAGVNSAQRKKANESLQKFMEDVNAIQNSLMDVIQQHCLKNQEKFNWNDFSRAGFSVVRGIDKVSDIVSATTSLASELPQVGQAAARGTLAMSRAARGGFIALNVAFIGVDLFSIVKDGIALSKGSETEISKCLRAKAALWKSEIITWEKMYESIGRALTKHENIESFY